MKRLLLTLLALVSLLGQAREVRSIKDLRPNDSFSLKLTLPIGSDNNSVWTINQSQKIDVSLQVLSVGKDSIEIAIKPTRWFIYYARPNNKDVNIYFDTDYLEFYDGKPYFFLFDDNSVIASINKTNGDTKISFFTSQNTEKRGRSRKQWYAQLFEIPKGLKINTFNPTLPDFDFNFEKTINASLAPFFKNWETNSNASLPMPWLIDVGRNSESGMPTFIQVMSASFNLNPNTFIAFKAPKTIPKDRIFIEEGNRKIRPTKQTNDSYEFSFFLPSPKRAYIQDVILDLTPSDSINISYESSSLKYIFEGKGASNSAYINSISDFYKNVPANIKNDSELNTLLARGEEFYERTLNQYSTQMNSYWLRSAKLSFDYWYTSRHLRLFNNKVQNNWGKELPSEDEIPWTNQHFKNIFPSADYLYQPYTYEAVVDNFYTYKARQANNSIMTGMKYLSGDMPNYDFADAIFGGYPLSHLASKTLKHSMIRFPLDESNRKYNDFLSKRHDPEVRESVINLHQQLMRIEPGANIKGLKLDVEKLIPLKSRDDKYIILLVGDEKIGYNNILKNYETNIKTIYQSLQKDLKENDLTDKVEICIITSESNKASLRDVPEVQNKITFVSDEKLRDYTDKVVCQERAFLILRSNGEILNRQHPSEYKSSIYFLLEVIKEDIAKQRNQDTTSSGVLIIILTILISATITFLVARYVIMRRERLKRHIQELELKAIRAQINPHFTFNALGSIQNLISQKKDKEANDYLINFAKLLRMVLSTSEKKLVPLSDEIELLNLYLKLEQLRIPFIYKININSSIDIENEEIPGMLIQPIVENAVKHGIVPKGSGEIKLNFKIDNKVLLVEVVDTGLGFPTANSDSKSGFGLKSVHERLQLLNKELRLNIDLEIENITSDGTIKGAKVSLHIPV